MSRKLFDIEMGAEITVPASPKHFVERGDLQERDVVVFGRHFCGKVGGNRGELCFAH